MSQKKGDAPVLVHAVREQMQGEGAAGILRALDAALARIHKEAGPKRHMLIGGNGIEDAIVCVGEPWQESAVQTKTVEKEKPFTYTKEMLRDALHEEGGRNLLIASLMNGYTVENPVGKRVKRADAIVLRSRIVPELYDVIRKAIRGAAGGAHARVVAFGEVAQVEIQVKKRVKRAGRMLEMGEVVIQFGSLEELNGLIDKLSNGASR